MKFDGQPIAENYLRTAWRTGRLAQSFAFVGPAGIGKRKAAIEFAAALLCPEMAFGACGRCHSCVRVKKGVHPDVRIYEPVEGKRVFSTDTVSDVMAEMSLSPSEGRRRIAILDRADQMNSAGANKFLKTLEEPPDTATIILLATEWFALMETIRSRVQAIRFVPLSPEIMRQVGGEEMAAVPDDTLAKLAPLAQGSPGRVLELASQDFHAVRDFLFEHIVARPVIDPVESAEQLIAMTRRQGEPNQDSQRMRLGAALGQAGIWWRDALVAGVLRVGEPIDPAAVKALKHRLDGVSASRLIEHVDRLLDMTGDLSMNMNLNLWALRFFDVAPHPMR